MRIYLLSWLFLILFLQILAGNNVFFVCGQCRNDQKWLLLQLKDGLNFSLASSTKLVNWNSSQNCCNWDGVACDSSDHVIGLDLNTEGIFGGIDNSSSLFSFQYLESLNLSGNNFNATPIPRGLVNLTNLRHLNLSNAGFVGQIPFQLTKMTRLVTLDLSTQFPGIQPLKLESPNLRTFVQNLTELTVLYLDGVSISAQGSEWCNALSALSNLTVLSLSRCHLSGPIDSSLSRLRSLSVIRLDTNNLSTIVPDFIASFSNLTVLSLSSCNLQGQFPGKIFQVPTLQALDLSLNNLTGCLPQFPQSGSLRVIVLSRTNFSGSLPESIGSFHSLSKIDLSYSNFTGPIPLTMTALTGLVHLDFSFNKFNGSVPTFQMSKKLQYLDLSHNHLTGSISSTHFEGLAEIVNIDLGYNSLSGSIPPSLFTLPALWKLLLNNNQFGSRLSEFPTASASSLDTLDLSSNQLQGSIPKSFFELKKLKVLLLSSNSFNGTMQLEMVKGLVNLTRLELSYNNLSIDARRNNSTLSLFPQLNVLKLASCNLQEFPDLKNQSKMVSLDLSDNQIEGQIPNWIWKVGNGSLSQLNLSHNLLEDLQEDYIIPSLLVLDLHSNKLRGEFPIPPESAIYVDYSSNHFNNSITPDIGKYISVSNFLSLSNNSLTGVIPELICNGSYLQVLDLSDNSFSGKIPKCLFENMEALRVLNLGRNNLSGTIPYKFPVNCGLKTLDLSRNSIEGQIPGSVVYCQFLEVLNIGSNKFTDTFPCMLKNLSSLRVLVLRSNMFHGNLHCSEANQSWPNLQIIDIASNNFSGGLSPGCSLNLRGMMTEDENRQAKENHIRFEFLTLGHLYYQDTVTVTMKGLELELLKILTVFTSIDFSCNNFEGRIPDSVGDLKALYVLNLSHNAFTGSIPRTIGNLTQLGSLDLSQNHLSGMIPLELVDLTFLSFLNLSFNKLSGIIPKGRQLQTFTETSFEGNTGLCGFPLNTSCNQSVLPPRSLPPSNSANSEVQDEFDWQFIVTGLGFGIGAAMILAPILVCKQARERCDKYLEKKIRLIFPTYGYNYTRYDEGKVEAVENFEDDFLEDTEDCDGEEYEAEDEVLRGRYCVYCSKLDVHRAKAVHNPKCICHSSPIYVNSPTSSYALLALYHHNF